MRYEIRGMIKIFSKNGEDIEIVVRDESGENYQSLKWPQGKPIIAEQVKLFLAEKMHLPAENFTIPNHLIKFFETEEIKEKEKK